MGQQWWIVLAVTCTFGAANPCRAEALPGEIKYRAGYFNDLVDRLKFAGLPEAPFMRDIPEVERPAHLLRAAEAMTDCHMKALQEYSPKIRESMFEVMEKGGDYPQAIRQFQMVVTREAMAGGDQGKAAGRMIQNAAAILEGCIRTNPRFESTPSVQTRDQAQVSTTHKLSASDADTRQLMVGSWVVGSRGNQRQPDLTTYRSDGTVTYVSYADEHCHRAAFTSEGRWDVRSGKLTIIVTESSDHSHRIRPGFSTVDEIVSIDQSRAVIRSSKGALGERIRASSACVDSASSEARK